MHPAFFSFSLLLTLAHANPTGYSPESLYKRTDQATFDNLVFFAKYASAAYLKRCPSPLGNTLVLQGEDKKTNTEFFIARDDTRQEIVTSFRGSQQIPDFITDLLFDKVPLVSPGVTGAGAKVHQGFITAYNSIADQVISTVGSELQKNPNYTLITTGHSLGGALSSLGGLSLKSNFPDKKLIMYTYGQPRTGDKGYVDIVETVVGKENIFRGVHTVDGVPTLLSTKSGYAHHGTEFWQNPDPPSAETTQQCALSDDPTCSTSIPSTGINAQHIEYFGLNMGIDDDPNTCGAGSGGDDSVIAGLGPALKGGLTLLNPGDVNENGKANGLLGPIVEGLIKSAQKLGIV